MDNAFKQMITGISRIVSVVVFVGLQLFKTEPAVYHKGLGVHISIYIYIYMVKKYSRT